MAPFYASLCQELHLELDKALLEELQGINKVKLEVGMVITNCMGCWLGHLIQTLDLLATRK